MTTKITLLSFLFVSACTGGSGPAASNSSSGDAPAGLNSDNVKMDDVPGMDEAPDGASGADLVPPVESAALFQFLKNESYKTLPSEPEIHPSFGPHGDVLVFANQRLIDSLNANSDSHPVGSAAIKELYEDGGLIGWAVEVKVAEESAPESWYWYETFDLETGTPIIPDGLGIKDCTGCHNFGDDFVTTVGSNFE